MTQRDYEGDILSLPLAEFLNLKRVKQILGADAPKIYASLMIELSDEKMKDFVSRTEQELQIPSLGNRHKRLIAQALALYNLKFYEPVVVPAQQTPQNGVVVTQAHRGLSVEFGEQVDPDKVQAVKDQIAELIKQNFPADGGRDVPLTQPSLTEWPYPSA